MPLPLVVLICNHFGSTTFLPRLETDWVFSFLHQVSVQYVLQNSSEVSTCLKTRDLRILLLSPF